MKQAQPPRNARRGVPTPADAPRTKAPGARASGPVRGQEGVLPPEPPGGGWTFLTNHAHVLILLSRDPSMVLRKVAAAIGITERAVQRIIADLEEGGFLEREKVGRQNHYRILVDRPLRHPIEAHRSIGDLLGLIGGGP
jgi:DNA-binding transcriptional ArsR family regulator